MADEPTARDAAADSELVRAFQEGDERAFVEIVNRYKQRLTRLALSVVRNEDDALDIVQDSFIKVYRSLQRFRLSAALYTWLYRVVMNRAIDHVRQQRRSLPELDSEEQLLRVPDRARDARPDTHALGNELRERIFAAIEKLPRKHREVILLREVEGLSYQEIAATVACSEGTVMSRLFYARERLRRELEPYLKDAG